jgi:hypothetical protein
LELTLTLILISLVQATPLLIHRLDSGFSFSLRYNYEHS